MTKPIHPNSTQSPAKHETPQRRQQAGRPSGPRQPRRRTPSSSPLAPATESRPSQSLPPLLVGPIEPRPIQQLTASPHNARTHSTAQIQQIAASIREFGFVNPILIGTDQTVIAGHARLQAARQLGLLQVPVIVLDHLTAKQRRALALADNQLALHAGWDEALLRQELAILQAEQFDVHVIGFDESELMRLLAAPDTGVELADADTIAAVPRLPVAAPGDLWILGGHRLLCGDATQRATLDTVLAGQAADLVFTDPPYNVAYQGKTARKLTIQNDALGQRFYDFLREACAHLIAMCRGGIYICMSSSELHTLHRAFTQAGGHWSTFLVWAKHHFTLGRADYQRQYELILYGWAKGAAHYWCGARDQGDVWDIPRLMANRDHPNAKPVELVERAIDNSS
jgi:ParB-like chromosome segregation protein Spo0J